MPATLTYPGVYVEELTSAVHTITGVATSIAAFIGWAPRGPVDKARLVLNWSDFNTNFGGLDSRSYLGYAVYHFFNNGGQSAYILRMANTDSQNGQAEVAQTASVAVGALTFTALNPGLWANDYQIVIKNQTGSAKGRFRVQVVYAPQGGVPPTVVESFENVGISAPDGQGRYVVDVIEKGSSLIRVTVATGNPVAVPNDVPAAPNAAPVSPSPANQLSGGKEGDVLTPGTPPFEKALLGGKDSSNNDIPSKYSQLDYVDLFNLLCVPGETTTSTLSTLEAYCEQKRAFLIADSDPGIADYHNLLSSGPGLTGKNAAFYFPWVAAPDLLNNNVTRNYPPCGFVAGMYATTDSNRGVWKAPAGTETGLVGVSGAAMTLSNSENGFLNPIAINCIRKFPVYGTVIWGARTTQGNDEMGSQWKYIPVRRMALFIEESLYRGTQWVVFEPNDEPLWAQIRLNVGAFMHDLFRQGAFEGQTPKDAYLVKCDKETTTQNDINRGIVNILVGFAPLKPAEFVVLQIQQLAGQIQT